jgi:hypothetical protein
MLHELEHAASALALTPNGNWIVKSGLSAFPKQDGMLYASGDLLLEEGAQEDIRWKHLDGEPPLYEQGVMLWEALIGLDPQIEKLRYEAKFLGRNRGELVGHIETLLGPLALDDLEAYRKTAGAQRLVNYPEFKDTIVGMVRVHDDDPAQAQTRTAEAKTLARRILDKVIDIFGIICIIMIS